MIALICKSDLLYDFVDASGIIVLSHGGLWVEIDLSNFISLVSILSVLMKLIVKEFLLVFIFLIFTFLLFY